MSSANNLYGPERRKHKKRYFVRPSRAYVAFQHDMPYPPCSALPDDRSRSYERSTATAHPTDDSGRRRLRIVHYIFVFSSGPAILGLFDHTLTHKTYEPDATLRAIHT